MLFTEPSLKLTSEAREYRSEVLRNGRWAVSRVSFSRRTRFWTPFRCAKTGKCRKLANVDTTQSKHRTHPCLTSHPHFRTFIWENNKTVCVWTLSSFRTTKQSPETCSSWKTDSRNSSLTVSERYWSIFPSWTSELQRRLCKRQILLRS